MGYQNIMKNAGICVFVLAKTSEYLTTIVIYIIIPISP